MKLIKNALTIFGVLSIAALLWTLYLLGPAYNRFNSFDDKAYDTYKSLVTKILESGNAAEATVWKMPVDEGLKPAEVEEVMKFVANEHNIKNVGELPLYKQVESSTGKAFRFMKIYMFCNALTAAKMVEYSDSFSAYLPCRVTLLEDKTGKLWLYSLNMDLMIHGGTPLPAELKKEALNVKKIILDIMKRGASGEF
ncbi:MAG: DUF302 domain-containing protein [Gammaproteobacteria bacterium]|nr:DUF302 domain-containing protein [Gammaproteobacteria bacterium]MDH5660407.1 DUF302 domain-containing protein [Gammaproteobacteria bacterium]